MLIDDNRIPTGSEKGYPVSRKTVLMKSRSGGSRALVFSSVAAIGACRSATEGRAPTTVKGGAGSERVRAAKEVDRDMAGVRGGCSRGLNNLSRTYMQRVMSEWQDVKMMMGKSSAPVNRKRSVVARKTTMHLIYMAKCRCNVLPSIIITAHPSHRALTFSNGE